MDKLDYLDLYRQMVLIRRWKKERLNFTSRGK